MQRKRIAAMESASVRALTAMAIGVLITAYGFQAANFLAWKLIGAPPRLFEEVRAFGFLYWPIYVAIAFALRNLGSGLPAALLFAALLVSPTMTVRMLPDATKLLLRASALRYGPADMNPEYLEKALGLRTAPWQEMDQLVESLRLARAGSACSVIGLEHEIKRSGCAVFVSYQDKRAALRNPGRNILLVWYLSYEEIRSAIESADPDRIANIAARYGAHIAVLPAPVSDPRFVPVFSGLRWHAYRIGS
jgi:hypothetical protein